MDRSLRHGDAFLVVAVVVRVMGNADGLGGCEKEMIKFRDFARFGNPDRASTTAMRIISPAIALHLFKHWEYVIIAPTGAAQLRPVIEILSLTTDVDHAVDRARSTKDAAPWNEQFTSGVGLAWFRPIAPIGSWIVVKKGGGDWHLRPKEGLVSLSRLEA